MVHPWTKLGGCAELMVGIARRLSRNGIAALAFDLRGSQASTGWSSFTGSSEVDDVIAACTWAVSDLGAENVVLFGSSAGAPIAGSAVDCMEQVRGYVGVGYVFGFWASLLFRRHYKSILESRKPKLFVTGAKDGFSPLNTFESYFEKCAEPKEKHVVDDVGHFELESPEYDGLVSDILIRFVRKLMRRLQQQQQQVEGQGATGADSSAPPAAAADKGQDQGKENKLETSGLGGAESDYADLRLPMSSSTLEEMPPPGASQVSEEARAS